MAGHVVLVLCGEVTQVAVVQPLHAGVSRLLVLLVSS